MFESDLRVGNALTVWEIFGFDLFLETHISMSKIPRFVPECHMIHYHSNGLFSYCYNCYKVTWEAGRRDPVEWDSFL